jgi:hypothetical protein
MLTSSLLTMNLCTKVLLDKYPNGDGCPWMRMGTCAGGFKMKKVAVVAVSDVIIRR